MSESAGEVKGNVTERSHWGSRHRASHRRPVALIAVLVAIAMTIFAGAPASAAAAPLWEIEAAWAPAHLPPGGNGFFYGAVTNRGDASSGQVSIQTTLPAGVTATDASAGTFRGGGPVWTCTGAGTSTVTCTTTGSVGPAWQVGDEDMQIAVQVAPGTTGTKSVTMTVAGGGASAPATTVRKFTVSDTAAGFGILSGSLEFPLLRQNGKTANQAGEHPDSFTTRLDFNRRLNKDNGPMADEQARDVQVDLPRGFVGDPTAVPQCEFQQLINGGIFGCPNSTQVGVVTVLSSRGGNFRVPVYNIEPPPDLPALFAFNTAIGPTVTMEPELRSDGDYGITVSSRGINQVIDLGGVRITFWGVPADPSHDVDRGLHPDNPAQNCLASADPACRNPAGTERRPFLTTPTDCSVGSLRTNVHVRSWNGSTDSDFYAGPAMTGCEDLPFEPTIRVQPTSTQPDSPTGLDVDLRVPQNDNPEGLATAHLEKAVVTLPEGMTVNPSSANGLDACTSAQIGLDNRADPTCPEASKIGSVEVDTPLLDAPLNGSVYVAKQGDNPFRSLLAIYIVAKGPGLIVKLPGHVDPDPQTGRLTTTFDDNPQLPFTSFRVRFKGGPRAPLANPPTCGMKVVETSMTPYSAYPEFPAPRVADPAKIAHPSDTFNIDCTPGLGGFAPSFHAGTTNPAAGAFSPFALRINRADGQQYMRGLSLEMPPGLIANVRGIPLCPNDRANAGTCDPASKVGTAVVGAGSGSQPFFTAREHGSVYLTEGYGGGPFGLATVVRAIAGPYDLGTVVVRQAIHVDRIDAHVTVVSDPMPVILEGIPLRVRSINVDIDRPGFMINPTSCAEKQIKATLTSLEGTVHQAADRFQAADCARLPLRPRLRMRLTGRKQTTDGKHPGLRAVLTQRPGQANLRRVRVKLPLALALDPENAQSDDLCEFAAGLRVDCPPSAIVGRARAFTPVLNRPLEGPVYFVKNVRVHPRTGRLIRTLPTLLIPLRGEVAIDLRATTDVIDEKLVSTFPTIPDAPVSRFQLNLEGGKDGILVATRNVCRRPRGHIADIEFDGQNGRRSDPAVRMRMPCAKKRKAGLKVGKVSWSGDEVTVSGRINRKAKRAVRVTVRCGRATVSGKDKPNRRGVWRTTLDTGGRCADTSRARVVARYAGDARVPRSRASRAVPVRR
jgi:hypothetical protein